MKWSTGIVPAAGVPEGCSKLWCTYQSLTCHFPDILKLDYGLGGRSITSVKGKVSMAAIFSPGFCHQCDNPGKWGAEWGCKKQGFREWSFLLHVSQCFSSLLLFNLMAYAVQKKNTHTALYCHLWYQRAGFKDKFKRYSNIYGESCVMPVLKLIFPAACKNYYIKYI